MPPRDGDAPARTAAPGSPWTWTLAVLTAALPAAIASDAIPALRGPAEWRWRLHAPPNLAPWRLAAPAAVAALIAVWWGSAARAARVTLARLGVLVVLAVAFRFAVQFTGRHGVEAVGRVMNPAYQAYFPSATRITDAGEFVRSYLARRDQRGFRELTHPPGNTLFCWTLVQAARRAPALTRLAAPLIAARRPGLEPWTGAYSDADVVAGAMTAVAIPAIGCLALVPLYFTARRLSGPRVALNAVALFALMAPGALFLPIVDDLQTFAAAAAALLAVEGVAVRRRALLAAAGLVLGLGTFLSYSMLPLGAFLALLVVLAPREGAARLPAAATDAAALAAGFGAFWLGVSLATGLDPVRLYQVSTASNFNARERSYWAWLAGNPYDLLLFAGVPVAAHVVAALGAVARRALRRRPLSWPDAAAAALGIAFAALFVSGELRGETARTLLYVFPFMAWLAAHDMSGRARLPSSAAVVAGALVLAQTLALHALLHVFH